MYALIKNDTVETYPYSVSQLYADNPDTSFPSPTPDSTLAEFGVFPVVTTPQPAYDSITQVVQEATPIETDGQWFQIWAIVNLDAEQIAYNKDQQAQQNKAQASLLLQQTDWTQVADCPLLNKQAYIDYRAIIRAIAINPPFEPANFPDMPAEQWSTT